MTVEISTFALRTVVGGAVKLIRQLPGMKGAESLVEIYPIYSKQWNRFIAAGAI